MRFSKYATPYIQERKWHHSQVLEPAPRSEVILTLKVGLAYELKQWILGFGPDVTVLEPPSLVEDIAVEAHRRALAITRTVRHGTFKTPSPACSNENGFTNIGCPRANEWGLRCIAVTKYQAHCET